MSVLRGWARAVGGRVRPYLPLVKSLQTGLLLITGLAGFSSGACPVTNWARLLGLAGSLALAISGSTVLNMVLDRDLDARMPRTMGRPLPAGTVSPRAAAWLGAALATLGLAWALALSPLYASVVLAGLFFDVVVYTLWLKRRTPWSIVWGGIAGGMPALAGRALAVGSIDAVGLILAAAVLLWIPTHIMTFSVRYRRDYEAAGVPTFPSRYGEASTRRVIALSSALAAAAMAAGALGMGMAWGWLRLLAVLSGGLLALALASLLRPSPRLNFGLFKFASLYMLSAMALVVGSGIR